MKKNSVIAIEANIELGRQVYDACHKTGLGVRVFGDSLDALMEAARSRPDLIVFDADTPVLGSLDFADVVSSDRQFKSVALIAIVDETDAVAIREYPSRGIRVAAKSKNDGKVLHRELSKLLKPFAVRDSQAGRSARHEARTKGAA